MLRKIVQIDEEKCDGCGLCVPECVEGALQIIDGKAKLVSDTYCDGLGACLGYCPQDAITIIEREAEDFDEEAVHGHQCPSSQSVIMQVKEEMNQTSVASQLKNWPIQITLVPPSAPYFQEAELLIAADCVPFAYANFHNILKDKVVLIGCPKLDEADFYTQKLGSIIKQNSIKSITIAHMEVPCCFGLEALVKKAVEMSSKEIPVKAQIFGISGDEL